MCYIGECKKYSVVHFFMMNSPLFNISVQEMVCKIDTERNHLFVYRYGDSAKCAFDKGMYAELDENLCSSESIEKYRIISDVIVVHSLEYTNAELAQISIEQASHMVWCVWGNDLYHIYRYKSKLYKWLREVYCTITKKDPYRKEATHRIENFRAIAAGFSGDRDEIRRRYGDKVKIYPALYPMGYFTEDLKRIHVNQSTNDRKKILIGHSAYSFLNHEKWLNALSKYAGDVQIHLPLSYGDAEYADKIQKMAYQIYGEDGVVVYRQSMPIEEYFQILSQIDIAIFDYERQSAFGNLLLLMYLKKRIYLSPTGVMYRGFKKLGLKVFSTRDILVKSEKFMAQVEEKTDMSVNKKYAETLLEQKNVYAQWKLMFDEICR